MHVVQSRPAPTASSTPQPAPTAPPSAQTQTRTAPGAGGDAGGPPGLAGMFGMGGQGGFGDMMDMQQQLMRNPEQIQAIMNSRLFEHIMNNPEIARAAMMANPRMREIMESNPEIAHAFNDPATFRQMMQMARNPSLMNEMMRNSDRQMANIEMMPGGFDALRRMHENVQAPLMDATRGFRDSNEGNNGGTSTDDNPFSSLFQQNTPSNQPMPNPWARNGGNGTQPTQPPTASRGGGMGQGMGGMDMNSFAQLFQGMGTPPTTTTGGTANPAQGGVTANPSGDSAGVGTGAGTGGAEGGFPSMFGMPAPGMNFDAMMQMLENNPMMQEMMDNMLQNPETLQAILNLDPTFRARMESNPMMASMMRDPELMRAVFNPETLRQMRQFRNAMNNASAGTQTGTTTGATGATAGTGPVGDTGNGNQGNPFDAMMQTMRNMGTTGNNGQGAQGTGTGTQGGATGQMPTGGAGMPNGGSNNAAVMEQLRNLMVAMRTNADGPGAAQPEMSQEQLEEMYSSQLQQLREMGFLDKATCLQALQRSQGDVSMAVENMLSRFGG